MTSKVVVMVLGAALAMPIMTSAQSATDSMHEAGSATASSARSAGHAIRDVYHGTKTATIDTTITGNVKTALDEDAATRHQDIHVKTVAGVVTLRGKVRSSSAADRAVHLAEQTGGVKSVSNRLVITTAAN